MHECGLVDVTRANMSRSVPMDDEKGKDRQLTPAPSCGRVWGLKQSVLANEAQHRL